MAHNSAEVIDLSRDTPASRSRNNAFADPGPQIQTAASHAQGLDGFSPKASDSHRNALQDASASSTSVPFGDSMLLSRPMSLKPFELEQGFEFGPPIPIAPGQFTKRRMAPVPMFQEDQPALMSDQQSPRATLHAGPGSLSYPSHARGSARGSNGGSVTSAQFVAQIPRENTPALNQHVSRKDNRENDSPRTTAQRDSSHVPPQVSASSVRQNDAIKEVVEVRSPRTQAIQPFRKSPESVTQGSSQHGSRKSDDGARATANLGMEDYLQRRPFSSASPHHEPLVCGGGMPPSHHAPSPPFFPAPIHRDSVPETPEAVRRPSLEHGSRTSTSAMKETSFPKRGTPPMDRREMTLARQETHLARREAPQARNEISYAKGRGPPTIPDSVSGSVRPPPRREIERTEPQQVHRNHSGSDHSKKTNPHQLADNETLRNSGRLSKMVNRPLRDEAPSKIEIRKSRPRPVSHSSNVSRRRLTTALENRSPRSSERMNRISESPGLSPTPPEEQVKISREFTTNMAGVINKFTTTQNNAIQLTKDHYKKKIRQLDREIAKATKVVKEQRAQLHDQNEEIKELQVSENSLKEKLHQIEAEVSASKERASKIEEKYRACKQHLNAAIEEQQSLYTRSKTLCDKTIEELRTKEREQNFSMEKMRQKAEAVREQMMERVRQVVAQNKQEARELYDKIDELTRQVEEKDIELNREREALGALSEKLADLQSTASGFEEVVAQNKKILAELGELKKQSGDQLKKTEENFQSRLESIMERIKSLSKTMSSQPEALSRLQDQHQEAVNTITSRLEAIDKSQAMTGEAAKQFSTDLEAHMEKICQQLDNQIEDLTHQLKTKTDENSMLATLCSAKEAECDKLENSLKQLRDVTDAQDTRIRSLQDNLVALADLEEENENIKGQLSSAESETKRLTEDLKTKLEALAELERQLKAKDQSFLGEIRSLSEQTVKLNQMLQDKDAGSRIAAEKAADNARREVRIEVEKSNAATKAQLDQVQRDRDALAAQVERLRQSTQTLEQNGQGSSDTIKSLKESLAAADRKCVDLSEENKRVNRELDSVRNRDATRVKSLEAELEAAKRKAGELQAHRKKVKESFRSCMTHLKEWTEKEGLNPSGEDLDNLWNGTTDLENIGSGLTQLVERLVITSSQRAQSQMQHLGLMSQQDDGNLLLEPSQPLQSPNIRLDVNDHDQSTTPAGPTNDGPSSKHDEINAVLQHSRLAVLQDQSRKVLVRSPDVFAKRPAPLSVAQEKSRRRGAMPPRSIMKKQDRSTSLSEDQNRGLGPEAFLKSAHSATTPNTTEVEIQDSQPLATNQDLRPANTTGAHEKGSESGTRKTTKRKRPDDELRNTGLRAGAVKRLELDPFTEAISSQDEDTMLDLTGTIANSSSRSGSRRPSSANLGHNKRAQSGLRSSTSSQGTQNATRQSERARQPSQRTYGSQRPESQSQSQSQSQSRYWLSTQVDDSLVHSQDIIGKDDDLLLDIESEDTLIKEVGLVHGAR